MRGENSADFAVDAPSLAGLNFHFVEFLIEHFAAIDFELEPSAYLDHRALGLNESQGTDFRERALGETAPKNSNGLRIDIDHAFAVPEQLLSRFQRDCNFVFHSNFKRPRGMNRLLGRIFQSKQTSLLIDNPNSEGELLFAQAQVGIVEIVVREIELPWSLRLKDANQLLVV